MILIHSAGAIKKRNKAMLKKIAFFLFLSMLFPVSAGTPPLAQSKQVVMVKLRSIQKISANNLADSTDLLYDASAHLHHSWDEKLLAEMGRVLNLSMLFDFKDPKGFASPFHLFLLSTKKDQFIEAILPYLDEANRKKFKRCVREALEVYHNGNAN